MHHALVMSDEPSTPAFLYSNRVSISDQTASLAHEHDHGDDVVVEGLDNQRGIFGNSTSLD
jgi:hypothetical protein